MNRQRGYYMPDMGGCLVALVLLGIAIGAVLAYGIPWLWSVVKPWLHAVTA